MTDDSIHTQRTGTLLAEDVLLALFDPSSGTIAGENTLFYVLGGAVLADLASTERAWSEDAGIRGVRIHAKGDAPDDPLLRPAWDYISEKPREVQGVLAAIGPNLRAPLLDRLVERGHLHRSAHRALGVFPTTKLSEGDTGRRGEIVDAMRRALVDGQQPEPRIAAVIALVSASGGLPTLHREIPWSGITATRAKEIERSDWVADAAAAAVTRTMIAIITNTLVATAVITNR
ncbi:GOLPH3/VPS74 family protein [Microbacterium hydrocarbonoxydans]|uniref:GOLPH3/VPS74 family protein n=1 Tax=Microbacterium hydrocarbonoxydans TaxID=273678 RepID=UPI00204048D0|nr:GPP34 family phosphoprotein [Microbacterium hydrocarbonoxydans]MCM3778665.1 GPP34 family phosphoprotein [Microbacterium hydrocarbonoxydans]